MTRVRTSISLPQDLLDKTKERVESGGTETNMSAFIERVLTQYLDSERTTATDEGTTAYYEESITVLREDMHRITRERDHERAEKAEYRARIIELEASIQTLTAERQNAEDNNRNLMAKVRAEGENYERALAEQEHRHKDVLDEEERRHEVITHAFRHEQELTQTKLEATQRELQLERDHSREIRDTMEQLQKQLELVTLRLPAPKEGFWARVFGRRKREQEG